MIPWSPLARGRLTRPWGEQGSTSRVSTDEFGNKVYSKTEEADRRVVERLIDVAAGRGVPPAQVGAGVDADQAVRGVADHRGDEDEAFGGCDRGAGGGLVAGGGGDAGGGVRAASGVGV